jgi:hypothetical protein
VLLLIALVVAALGIATTLAVLVLQRRRQLNTIRAVGGSKSQLRRMIFWEAGLIVMVGQAAGLACGFHPVYLLIFVVNLQSFGWTFVYQVDWPSLLMAVPLIFAAALLAALPAVNGPEHVAGHAAARRNTLRNAIEDLPAEFLSKPVAPRNCPTKWACRHFSVYPDLILIAAPLLRRRRTTDFLQVTGPCKLSFPADHGPHIGLPHRMVVLHRQSDRRRQPSLRLSADLFPQRVATARQRQQWPDPASAWRTDQIYLAHAAITDIDGGRHLQAETDGPPGSLHGRGRASGEPPGRSTYRRLADHHHREQPPPVGHCRWIRPGLEPDPGQARGACMVIEGYSQKGQSPERASCYYSFTRLQAQGSLSIEGQHHAVAGSAWMDHEFSTAPLQPGISGWDWFSLQLSDRTEIMIFFLRQGRWEPQ